MAVEDEPKETFDEKDIVSEAYSSLDKSLAVLDELPKMAEEYTDAMRKLLLNGKEFFTKENLEALYNVIDDLYEQSGNAIHMVEAIELARERVKPQTVQSYMPEVMQQQPNQQTSPSVVVQSTPSKGGGLWDYMGTKALSKAWERVVAVQKGMSPPQITTSKQVVDILDFGRQLYPKFNNILKNIRECIDRLYFFNDDETKERLYSDFREELPKVAGIIRGFTRMIVEYRKELVSDRKAEIAKAALALQMAKATAQMGGRAGPPISIDPNALAMRDRVR